MNTIETKPDEFIAPKFFPELQASVDVIIGLPYLFSRVSYGDELTIHFGSERKHTHPKLAEKVRGSHVLSVRGSEWMLRSGIKPVIVGCGIAPISSDRKPFNITALESGAFIGQSATVTKASPIPFLPMNSIGLILDLSDGSSFTIIPTPPCNGDDDDGPEPSDWELLTATQWMHVGPGSSIRVDPL